MHGLSWYLFRDIYRICGLSVPPSFPGQSYQAGDACKPSSVCLQASFQPALRQQFLTPVLQALPWRLRLSGQNATAIPPGFMMCPLVCENFGNPASVIGWLDVEYAAPKAEPLLRSAALKRIFPVPADASVSVLVARHARAHSAIPPGSRCF